MAREINLPPEWEFRRLDEVSTVVDSLHKTPAYSSSGPRMVRVTDVQGGFLDVSAAYNVTEDVYAEFTKRHEPKRGDIVFSRVGSYGNASYVNADERFCLGQNTAIISPSIRSRFLHLCLESPSIRRQIEETVVGSTQKTISLKNINALRVPVPPQRELDAITDILTALDDKIELNRRMNATLEATARAVFKSWFVDFDPVRAKLDGRQPHGMTAETATLFPDRFEHVGGELVPAGWEKASISQLANFVNGRNFTKKATPHGRVVIRIAELNSGIGGSTKRSQEQPDDKHVAYPGDILFAWSGSLTVCRWWRTSAVINQHIFKVVCDNYPDWFVYRALMDTLPWFRHIAASKATTMGHIKRGHLVEATLVVPPKGLLAAAEQRFRPIHDLWLSNAMESETLADLRDTLLPKLLSGELRVPAAEEVVEEAS